MQNTEKKLEFYGGEWISFLPILIFVTLIIVTTFIWGSTSDGALWLPIFSGILITFFLAKNKKAYSNAVIDGLASRGAAIPIICWLFAGVFARILRVSGFATGIAGLASNFGMGATEFTVVSFLVSALFSSSTGTGFGTIAMGMGVLYPAGLALGIHPALLAGSILSGAAVGDNLAPVSDTTISSATALNVDVAGVVKSRFKYAAAAGLITIIAIVVASKTLENHFISHAIITTNPKALIMFIPLIITLVTAIRVGDIIIATTIGTVLAAGTAVAVGLIDIIHIDVINPSVPALINVSGAGLDRVVDGVIFDGLSSMVQVIILCLLLFGAISIMKQGHGDIKMLQTLGKVAKGPIGAELTVSTMIILLSSLISLTAPSVLLVGASFGKPMAEKYGISPYRMANLISAQACTFCYSMPWTATMMYLLSFTKDSGAPLTGMQVMPLTFYSFAMIFVMLVTTFLRIGRNDNMENIKTNIQTFDKSETLN